MSQNFVERLTFQSGDYVFREGDSANNAYIVQSGSVLILKAEGEESTILAEIPEGGIFGEMALIDDAPRMASARLKKGGTLIVVTRAAFEEKLRRADPFIRTLLKIFVETIRSSK